MTKHDFKDYICRPFCLFYKEGQKEEMACRGALVVESLVQRRLVARKELSAAVKDRRSCLKHKDLLTRRVCRHCSFMKADCDFQSEAPSDDLEPCGGYALLACLIENRVIDTLD
jgi:hypothetical protein